MLDLTYSNRTEALLEQLAGRIREERAAGRGIWEPVQLVVPNPYLREYLRQGLARHLGVAANLRFSYLDGLWQDFLVDDRHRLLGFDQLRAGLLKVLADPGLLAAELFRPVRDYLGAEQGGLKRIQLATELARVFEEYQRSRPAWIDAWRAGKPGPGAGADPALAAWQSRLWLELVRSLDGAAPAGRELLHCTLVELIRGTRLTGLRLPRAIHAFGLSHVAQAYQEVFKAFGPLPDTTLHIYALNPCAEFWEDLDTTAVLPRRLEARRGPWDEASEDFYGLAAQGPRALRLWGRPGRERIRLLNEVTDCDFTPLFRMPEPATLLGRMQRDILLYLEPDGAERSAPDGSVRILACPSPRREAEVVATEIWRLLEASTGDAPLRFSDIAVVVPPGEQEAYLAHLQAAFHDAQGIPMVQSDRVTPILAQTLEAAALLLELPGSGLTRAAMLRVLQHPALQRRNPDLDVAAWTGWCDELGIVRGGDRQDWAGSYLESDALNWDQGLKRLALGAFMTEGDDCRLGPDRYRVPGAKGEQPAAAFIAQVRGLAADARELQRARLAPRAWMARLGDYLERWLRVDEGEEAEAVLKALERLGGYLEQPFGQVPADLELPALDWPAARHLAREALERLKGEQPASLARGVVVSSYATMRAIPFRAIFLMGNGEGSFPTRNQRSALDLRAQVRHPGDVSQIEKEKYLFLEMLLSARETLVLSYVGLDELSGERFEPSGLCKEFRTLLDGYLDPAHAVAEPDPFVETHPLRRFDPAYFPAWFHEPGAGLVSYSAVAQAEARALWLGQEARRSGLVPPSSLGELPLAGADLARLREALHTAEVPDPGPGREVIRLGLHELLRFLECPLSGAGMVRLGLRKGNLEDRAAVEDEPFESDFLEAWWLQREVVLGTLAGEQEPEAIYDRAVAALQAEGASPFGLFSAVEKRKHLVPIGKWVDYLRKCSQGARPGTWRLGGNRSGADQVDHALPVLGLTVEVHGQPRRVELSGELRVQLDGSLFLETGQPPSESAMEGVRRKALAGYLDHLLLACVDPGHFEHSARFVFTDSKNTPAVQETRFHFPPVSAAQAREQLGVWIGDLLNGGHAVLLPIEAVLKHWKNRDLSAEGILDYVDAQLEKTPPTLFSTTKGPVPDPTRFPPPERPQELAEARLGAFMACLFPPAEAL